MKLRHWLYGFVLVVSYLLSAWGQSAQPPFNRQNMVQAFGALPLGFEENQGQTDRNARFVSRTAGYSVYLSEGELRVVFSPRNKKQITGETIRIALVRAEKNVEPQGSDLLPGVTNYYLGNDPAKWRTNVRQYRQIRYSSVYPGVDLVFYGNHRQLEFDFDVAPGGNVSEIGLRIEGAKVKQHKGNLELTTPSGNVAVVKKPELYQGEGTDRHQISGGYKVRSLNEVAFTVGRYDKRQTLVIDPALIYSTLADLDIGTDGPSAVAVDSTGAAYILGQLFTTIGPNAKMFVAKFNPSGSALVYESYVGSIPGSSVSTLHSNGEEIVADANGNVYVTGRSNDPNFPTTSGTFNPTHACAGTACEDPFAFKLDASGKLAYSTFLVRPLSQSLDTAAPFLSSIAVDSTGALYATGTVVITLFNGLPTQVPGLTTTAGAFQTKRNNGSSAFVFKLH